MNTISIFEEEYNYWRACGETHFNAKNKAIDYYRQYTRREILESDTMTLDMMEGPEVPVTEDEKYHFNQIVEKFLSIEYGYNGMYGNKEKVTKMLFLVIRMENLDQYLNFKHAEMSHKLIGDVEVLRMQDIAVALGYKVKSNGTSTGCLELKYGLQNILRDFGLVDGGKSTYSFS